MAEETSQAPESTQLEGQQAPESNQVEEAGTNEWDVAGKEVPPVIPEPVEGTEPTGEAKVEEDKTVAPPSKPEEEVTPPADDAQEGRLREMEIKISDSEKRAGFYETQYNELLATTSQAGQQTMPPGTQPPAPKAPEQQDITEPEAWENQTQMAQYISHHASKAKDEAQQAVMPYVNRLNANLTALQEAVVKSVHPDFDDVVKTTWDEVFTHDPSGKIVGVKNQGLLRYFQQQPFPQKAAYEYGLGKKAPENIKKGTQEATQKVFDDLNKKPKAPTKPRMTTTQAEKAELDWNTPRAEAEKILDRKGLIG